MKDLFEFGEVEDFLVVWVCLVYCCQKVEYCFGEEILVLVLFYVGGIFVFGNFGFVGVVQQWYVCEYGFWLVEGVVKQYVNRCGGNLFFGVDYVGDLY